MKASQIAILMSVMVALVAMTGCFKRPAIRLERAGGASVVVHVETLGEYPTTIRHVEIKEISSGKVVFDLLADSGSPQIYNFRLIAGENPTRVADPEHGSYRVDEPKGKATFTLQKGARYRLTIWGDGWPPSKTDVQF